MSGPALSGYSQPSYNPNNFDANAAYSTTPSMSNPDVSSVPPQLTNLVSSPEQPIMDTSQMSSTQATQTPQTQQLVNNLANLAQTLAQMTPDQANQLLLSITTSTSVMNDLFNGAGQNPQQQQVANTLVNALVTTGNVGMLGNLPTTDTAQASIQQALQQTLGSMMTNAAGGQALLILPTAQGETATTLPQNIALMLSQGVMGAMGKLNPQVQSVSDNQTQMQNVLGNLMTLTFASQGTSAQIKIPATTGSTTVNVPDLAKQLQDIGQQFTNLSQALQSEHIDIGPLQSSLQTPGVLLAMLPSADPGTLAMMKTWADNSDVVQQAIAGHAGHRGHEKVEFMKGVLATAVGKTAAEEYVNQQIAQQTLDLQQLQAGNLLNFYKLKDVVESLSSAIKSKNQEAIKRLKVLLYNAGREIIIVAAGEETAEYTEVGIFHPILAYMAAKLKEQMSPSASQMDLDQMEAISHEITHGFEMIKVEDAMRLREILKRHPRTSLYLLSIDSPVCEGIQFPGVPSKLYQDPDPREVAIHVMRVLKILLQYKKMAEFYKYQPRVLEIMLAEVQRDPKSDVTRNSLKVVHKAIQESNDMVDLGE